MNKKLIALAVAGACVAPAALAQTANPVTLYGRAYVTIESIEAKNPTVARRTRMNDQSSLLGVRGTEDLGGGLKAFFQLETQFKPDQNDTTFAARNSGVGLQGGWGSVLIGRWDMPFKTTTIAVDPYGDLTIGGITAANNDQGNFDVRAQNVIQYWSPTWGGFAARLALTTNETRTTATATATNSPCGTNFATGTVCTINPRMIGGSVTYTGGPVYVGYAYEQHKDATSSSGVTGLTPGLPGYKEKGHALFGTFTFGPFKLGALGEKFEKPGRSDKKSFLANVVWTLGNNQLIYQVQRAKDGQLFGAAAPKCTVHSPGWQYNFSRRTFFLAQYTTINNSNGSTCGNAGSVFSSTLITSAGNDGRGVSLGLRHIF